MGDDNDGREPGVIERTNRPFYEETRSQVPASSLSVPCLTGQWLGLGFVRDKVEVTIVPDIFARPGINKERDRHHLGCSIEALMQYFKTAGRPEG